MANVWVKNLKTGLKWLVTEEHAERLLKSGEYERVDKVSTKKSAKKSQADEPEGKSGK